MLIRIASIFIVVVLLAQELRGQENPEAIPCDTLSFRFDFRWNRSLVDSGYHANRQTVLQLRERLASASFYRRIDTIRIVAYASPEGRLEWNRRLAQDRAVAVRGYLRWKYPYLKQKAFLLTVGGEDWEGLTRAIESDRRVPGRSEVLEILRTTADPVLRKQRLKACEEGRSYDYIVRRILPWLRSAASCVVSCRPGGLEDDIPVTLRPVDTMAMRYWPLFPAVKPVDGRRCPRVALKTNLLYLAALVPNLELECYIANRWSVNVECQYAWWSRASEHQYYRVAAVSPELRYWLSKKERFHGHFIGMYAGAGMYEFMNGPEKGIQGEFMLSGGLTYGYTFPLGRRLRMELSLGGGALLTDYRQYYFDAGCYVYEATKRQFYMGLTKAKVSLVWPLW